MRPVFPDVVALSDKVLVSPGAQLVRFDIGVDETVFVANRVQILFEQLRSFRKVGHFIVSFFLTHVAWDKPTHLHVALCT